MKIQRRSPLTGKVNEMELNVTEEQIKAWKAGALIQNVMSGLTADEREFLVSGCFPGEFESLYPEE